MAIVTAESCLQNYNLFPAEKNVSFKGTTVTVGINLPMGSTMVSLSMSTLRG